MRNVSIISFTENGIRLSEKIAEKLGQTDAVGGQALGEVQLFTKCTEYRKHAENRELSFVAAGIEEWAGGQMGKKNAILFVGACGIAVRAIAPHITDKLHDCPVLVADERGRYVIPILSGHMGGANELACFFAEKIGAEPVITTATDINGKFAVDLFAKKNGLFVVNKAGIAKVSAKVLAGEKITISVEPGHCEETCRLREDIQIVPYPPTQQVDVVITSGERKFDAALLLRPREYVIGMGCRKGKEAEEIETFIRKSMEEIGITGAQVAALSSVDAKCGEQGLLAWSTKEQVPFLTYSAEELQRVKGDFQKSDFVKKQVGVDNVCERAALRAAGTDGRLIYGKHARDGMTIAVAKKEWRVNFDEA